MVTEQSKRFFQRWVMVNVTAPTGDNLQKMPFNTTPGRALPSSRMRQASVPFDRRTSGLRSGLALQEAFQVGGTVDHISYMSDRLVDDGPDLITGHTTPSPTEGVVF
jgi:hypothetical protein